MKTNILDTLQALKIQVERTGANLMFSAIWRGEKKASCKVISDTRFVDYGESESKSFDSIDLIMKVLNTDFKGAKKYIENRTALQDAGRNVTQDAGRNVTQDVKIKNLDNNYLLQYCLNRGISGKVAKAYLSQAYYNEGSKWFNNIAMVNNAGGVELRGNKNFKGAKGAKDISTFGNKHAPQKIFLFEGMFDFVSFIELIGSNIDTSKDGKNFYIVLHSTSQIGKAIELIRAANGITEISAFFDTDEAGRKCFESLKLAFPLAIFKTDKAKAYYSELCKVDLSDCNDLNEILMKLRT